MKLKPRRPSAAMLVATIALVATFTGVAYAAKIDTQQIKKKAVTSKKIAGKAVTTPKLAREAVTTAKLSPGERSEGYVTANQGATALPAATNTIVASLNLPTGGAYVVNASASLGNNAAAANLASCELRDDGVLVNRGNGALPALAAFAETISLPGVADGGLLTLACQLDNAGQARDRVITATRVNALGVQ